MCNTSFLARIVAVRPIGVRFKVTVKRKFRISIRGLVTWCARVFAHIYSKQLKHYLIDAIDSTQVAIVYECKTCVIKF